MKKKVKKKATKDIRMQKAAEKGAIKLTINKKSQKKKVIHSNNKRIYPTKKKKFKKILKNTLSKSNFKNKIRVIKKTKPAKEEKISTGVENLDKITHGGFELNSTNLIVGDSGSGKTILATQFLIEGIKRGEKCLYITFEEKKEEFFKNMLDFGWDLKEYEKEGRFIFLEYTPEKVKTMLEEGGGTIETIVLTKKITRIVIDSITSFALLFDEDLKKREAALELFNMLRKWECTALLTYEEEPFRDKKNTSKTMEFESDSIIIVYYIRTKEERKRYIEVMKMRGTSHSNKVFPLEITKKGIVIGNKPYPGKISEDFS